MGTPRLEELKEKAACLLVAEKQLVQAFMYELWEVLVDIDDFAPQLAAELGELIEHGSSPYLARIHAILSRHKLHTTKQNEGGNGV